MQSFKDRVGREWSIDITVAEIKRVKQLLGVDLNALALDGGGQGLIELLDNPVQLVDVLYVLCKEQADKEGMTDEQFGRSFAGDSVEAAANALLQEVLFFIRNPQMREALRKVTEKAKQLAALGISRAEKRLAALDLEKELDSLEKRLGISSGSGPANSASTPAPSASANSP